MDLLDVLCTCHTADRRSWATRVVGSGLADVGRAVYRLAADRLALIHTFTPTFRRLCDQGLQAINQPIQNNVVVVAFVCLCGCLCISEFPYRKSVTYIPININTTVGFKPRTMNRAVELH